MREGLVSMRAALSLIIVLLLALALRPGAAQAAHGIAMYGELKYGPGFRHLDYVNPDAPKGGRMRLAGAETYDSFNAFIPKGLAADGLALLYMPLMERSADEPFSMYGALAESAQLAADRKWVVFTLRRDAKWHDGVPVTAEDVVWTLETLREKGAPFYHAYYSAVEKVEALDRRRVKFTFSIADNRELPMIVGDLIVLPKHYWTAEGRNFAQTTLTPPVGSGPYQIGSFVAGRSLEYKRVEDWWAKDLPLYRGRYNFNRIRYDYYRDQNVSLEALFAGAYDLREEYVAKLWATAYNAQAVRQHKILKKRIANKLPQGMQAFAMNIRRPVFQDIAVRKALNYAFDFEWSNKQFAYGAYTRTRSFFQNSDAAATGIPEGLELETLEAYRDRLPPELFTQEYNPPATDGSGNNRENLREAARLLREAGYVMGKDQVLYHPETKRRLAFTFLISNTNSGFERWFGPYRANLARLGIKADIRIVDASQYINSLLAFDYDFIIGSWAQSTSPGAEQREYWGSEKAHQKGSRNYIGVSDPVVDELIQLITTAPTEESLEARTRALDRVLQWGWYVVPNWHIPAWRVAYWDKFRQPETQAPYSLGYIDTWWAKSAEEDQQGADNQGKNNQGKNNQETKNRRGAKR